MLIKVMRLSGCRSDAKQYFKDIELSHLPLGGSGSIAIALGEIELHMKIRKHLKSVGYTRIKFGHAVSCACFSRPHSWQLHIVVVP